MLPVCNVFVGLVAYLFVYEQSCVNLPNPTRMLTYIFLYTELHLRIYIVEYRW